MQNQPGGICVCQKSISTNEAGDKSLSSARLLGKLSTVADIEKQGIFS